MCFPTDYEVGKVIAAYPSVLQRQPMYNFFQPFQNALDFKLARFLYETHVPKAQIDMFFKDGFLGQNIYSEKSRTDANLRFSFRSASTLYQKIDQMITDPPWKNGFVDFNLAKNMEFWYRNILESLKYLLRRKSFAPYMCWAPVKQFDTQQERVYTEMNTASWWWDTQMTLPVGATLVPVLFASDATHLINFSGDGKVWPIYMSIGNIKSRVRNKPTSHVWIPVALLPHSPKFILRPLSDAAQDGLKVKCADEVIRKCHFRVASWLADHMENATIHGIYATRCPICECPQEQLGQFQEHPVHNAEKYRQWVNKSDAISLHDNGVKSVNNALWTLKGAVPQELIRSDILHTMLLENLQHLMDWIKGFLESHNRLLAFDNIWSSLPRYSGNHVPRKSYRLLSQLFGKEMRSILRVILGVFTASLCCKTDTARLTAALGARFQESNHFKAAKARADVVSKELTKRNRSRNLGEDASGRTATQKAHAAAEDREERAYLVNQVLVEDSHFNFPKIHLIMHWADQISRYGSLHQFSTEICETSHNIPQVIRGYSQYHSFAVRELEIAAWAEENLEIQGEVERCKQATIFITLKGKRWIKIMKNMLAMADEFRVPEIDHPQSDAERILLNAEVQAYNAVEIPVPDQDVDDNNCYQLQHVHIESMRLRPASVTEALKDYHSRVIGFLNALFTVRGTNNELYKLGHVTLLDWMGNQTPYGSEGMFYVQEFKRGGGQTIVWLRAIEGAAHLIPLEPERKWIVNNRVDYHVWNEMNDG
ncbi:hypothetical protein EV426DRAFT_579132 [Tirmania nivea]|nr:hypothetical protein EV426DRAFT_579132 [Tirmania nivea]